MPKLLPKNRYLLIVSIILFALAFGIYALPYLMSWEGYRKMIESHVEKTFHRTLDIEGGITYKAFPTPKLVLNDVRLKNYDDAKNPDMLYAPRVEIQPSLVHLVQGRIVVSNIVFSNAELILENYTDGEASWNTRVSKESDKEVDDRQVFDVELLSFTNAKMTIESGARELPVRRQLVVPHGVLVAKKTDGPFSVQATMINPFLPESFDVSLEVGDFAMGGDTPAILRAKSADSEISVDAVISRGEEEQMVVTGKTTIMLAKTLQEAMKQQAINSNQMAVRSFSSLLSGSSSATTSDFVFENQKLVLNSLSFKTAENSMTGDIAIEFGKINTIDTRLKIDKVNLDAIMAIEASYQRTNEVNAPTDNAADNGADEQGEPDLGEVKSSDLELEEEINPSLNIDRLPRDVRAKIDISMGSVLYKDSLIESASMSAELKDGNMLVRSIDIKDLPGQTFLQWKGKFEDENNSTNIRRAKAGSKLFGGELVVKGGRLHELLDWLGVFPGASEKLDIFALKAQIDIYDTYTLIPRVNGVLKATPFFAKAKILNENGKRSISIASSFKKIDLLAFREDAPEVEMPAVEVFNPNMLFSSGPSYHKGIAYQFDFLRHINFFFDELKFTVKMESVKYTLTNFFRNIEIAGAMHQGRLVLDEMKADSREYGAIKADVVLDYRTLTPTLSFGLSLREIDLSDYVKPPPNVDPNAPKYLWSTKRMDLSLLKGTTGTFKLKADTIKLAGAELKRVNATFDLFPKHIVISKFNARAFGGEIDVEGNYGLDVTVLTLALQGTRLKVSDTFKQLFAIDNFTDGVYNMSFGISTSGLHFAELLRSLEGTMSLSVRDVKMDGFDLLGLADRIPTLTSEADAEYWSEAMLRSGSSEIGMLAANMVIKSGKIIVENVPLVHGLFSSAQVRSELDVYNWKQQTFANFALRTRRDYAVDIPVSVAVSGRIDAPLIEWKEEPIVKYWNKFYYR